MLSTALRDKKKGILLVLWAIGALLVVGAYYKVLWRLFEGNISIREVFFSGGHLSLSILSLFAAGLILLLFNITTRQWRDLSGTRLFSRRSWILLVAALSLVTVALFGVSRLPSSVFPFIEEAAVRNARALFGCAAVLFAAFTLGRLALRAPGGLFEDWKEEFLFAMGLGLGCISLCSLAMALAGWYNPLSVQCVIGALDLLGIALVLPKILKAKRDSALKQLDRPIGDQPEPGKAIWKTIAALSALIGLIGALAPEVEYDALWYHLWLPKLWLQAGRPVDLVQEYISLYPLNLELIFGVAIAIGGPIAAKLIHYACFLLTGLLVYAIVRRFSLGAGPWLAVALFLTAPTVLWEATTAYADLGLAFYGTLFVYALLRYADSQKHRWLLLAAIAMGFALGTKHLALLMLCSGTLGIFVWGRMQKHTIGRSFGLAFTFFLIGVLLASPWYVRSYAASGNPFFPDLYSIFGATPPERWSAAVENGLLKFKDHFGDERTLGNFFLLPWHVTTSGYRFGATFGPLFLILVPPLLLRRQWTLTNRALVFCVTLYAVMWAMPISSFQGRFLVPILPLTAALAAAGFAELSQGISETKLPRGKSILIIFVSVIMLLNLPPFISLHEGGGQGWGGWLTHVMRKIPARVVFGETGEEDYLRKNVPSYAAWQFINTSLPDSARILTFGGGDHFYSDRNRLWSESAMAFPAVWGAVGQDQNHTRDALRKLNITHILLENSRLEKDRSAGLPISRREFLESWCVPEYQDPGYALYRIRQNDPVE